MREYPAARLVGVGAVVSTGDRVLLVQRGHAPARGRWSLPGTWWAWASRSRRRPPGGPRPGSDALAVRWSEPGALGKLDVTEGVESMVRRAFALEAERRQKERE